MESKLQLSALKKTLLLSIIVSMTVFLSSFFLPRFLTKTATTKQTKQLIYGPTTQTRSYHNSECIYCNNDPYPHECIDKWCFGVYELTVSAPQGWYFTGEPQLNCVEDNEGSFSWNWGYTNRAKILERTPRFMKVKFFIGSRSIKVNLKCEATKD